MARGGYREKSGRKGFCENSVPVCWRVSRESADWIKGYAATKGITIGSAIDMLVKSYNTDWQ